MSRSQHLALSGVLVSALQAEGGGSMGEHAFLPGLLPAPQHITC